MTLTMFLTALYDKLVNLEQTIANMEVAGMSPEQQAALEQAVTDVAALRDQVTNLQSTVEQVQTDVDAFKVALGDLSTLPQI